MDSSQVPATLPTVTTCARISRLRNITPSGHFARVLTSPANHAAASGGEQGKHVLRGLDEAGGRLGGRRQLQQLQL